MTRPDDGPEFSPLPPDAPKEDRIGTAFLAMGSGTAATVAWFALLTYIQIHLLTGVTASSVAQVDPQSFDANFMTYGVVLGIAFGATVAWALMAPIPSSYRRGGLAIVAAFAGVVLGAILTALGRENGGRLALAGLAAVSVTTAFWLGRRAVLSAR